MIGTKLTHYEILSAIGKGGMGEVWRARDTKLGREVAIKTLPEEFAKDSDRLARFEREAKLLASLNHTNIASIHGYDQDNGTHFLAMELVEGDTLADRVGHGPLPVADALELALQIGEALEAAHEKGVIHRDLKPANIKVTPEGKVKVLDFGLAKAFEGDGTNPSMSHSPTISVNATQQGVILGTAAYMSPEQARGETTDTRTDVWAFGCVLFEMLSGQQTWSGRTVTDVIAGLVAREPDWNALPANLHPRIRFVLERCLEKEAKDRSQGIAEARTEIKKALADPSGVITQPIGAHTEPGPPSKLPWVAALALTGVAIIGTWVLKPLPQAAPDPVVRWDYVLPEGQGFRNTTRSAIAISPDGLQIVYNGLGGLYLRAMGAIEARVIPGTEDPLTNPTFSPDGQWLAFYSIPDAQLQKIAVVGGTAVTLVAESTNPLGISWDTLDTILYTTASGVMSVPADGGEANVVIGQAEAAVGAFPQLLPGGNTVLTNVGGGTGTLSEIAVYSIDSGESKLLFPGNRARYLPTGHVVYALNDVLFAVPFDLDRLEVTGGPVPLVEGVQSGPPQYSVSDTGWLVYRPGTAGGSPDGLLAFTDRNGGRDLLDLGPAQYRSPRVSPNGDQIVVEIIDINQQSDIWVYDLSGNSAIRRLTREGNNTRPVWTPDGERITFASDRDGTWGIYWREADGSDVAQRLTTSEDGAQHLPESWSPNLETLSYSVVGGDWDIWTLSMESGVSEVFRGDVGNQFGSAFSPDGNWLAYTEGANSISVDVQPFPPTGVQYDVLQDGESWPVWSADGAGLFARLNLALQSAIEIRGVNISTDPTFTFGNPTTLPMQGAMVFQNYRDYDISPDGERFLMIVSPDSDPGEAPARPRLNVVQNWFEELKERVPVP